MSQEKEKEKEKSAASIASAADRARRSLFKNQNAIGDLMLSDPMVVRVGGLFHGCALGITAAISFAHWGGTHSASKK